MLIVQEFGDAGPRNESLLPEAIRGRETPALELAARLRAPHDAPTSARRDRTAATFVRRRAAAA